MPQVGKQTMLMVKVMLDRLLSIDTITMIESLYFRRPPLALPQLQLENAPRLTRDC